MNIIALLESISLDKSRIGSFSKEDYTQIKNQLVAQMEANPEVSVSDVNQLLKALKEPEVLQAVLNNRILFNFFAKKDYTRERFSDQFATVDTTKIKTFVNDYFGEELKEFFIKSLDSNNFSGISQLVEAKNYFPDNVNFILRQQALNKLDDAIAGLTPPYSNLSKLLYVKDSHFFMVLNEIKDQEIEQKIFDLSNTLAEIYKIDYNSEIANKTYMAMNNYKAFSTDLSNKIRHDKEIAETRVDSHIHKRRNLTWVYVLIGTLIVGRVALFLYDISPSRSYNSNDTYYDEQVEYSDPPKVDRYYTNMKYSIDSFQVFLTSYTDSEVKQMTRDINLKTGDNPFETFYDDPPAGESNHFITVTNNTGYDMVLLENAIVYDSIKVPRSAHFIKAGDQLDINFKGDYTETIFNMYLGKKWGTFQTATNKNLFIRRKSIVEYRFSELAPQAKDILEADYSFINDAVVTYSKGDVDIDSPGAVVNPLDKYKEED